VQKNKKKIQLYIALIETLQNERMAIPNTFAFVGSPEIVTALAIAGDLNF
jgi:aconitase A